MNEEQLERRISRIKRRLKRHHAWGKSYLEEMARNQAQVYINKLTNRGDSKIVKYLLLQGFSVDEIVSEGKKVHKLIVKHHKKLRRGK